MSNIMFLETNGDLHLNGVTTEMRVVGLSNVRIQASGTGSCKLVGKLRSDGEFKTLATVRLSDYAVCDTIADNELYAVDVSGLYSITLQDVEGFDRVFIKLV